MRYVLLVCNDESEELSPQEAEARYVAYAHCQKEMEARGALLPGSVYGRPRPARP